MPIYLYVSLQDDDKISVYTMDAASGRLEHQRDETVTGGPAALATDPERKFLYVGRRGIRELSSYGIDQVTGGLSFLGTASLEGEPVFLATDRRGKFVLSAYYYQSIAAVHPIDDRGVAGTPPTEWLQTASGAHAMQTDPSNRFAFVPHIAGNGPNAIYQFKFDESTGRLTPNSPAILTPEELLGPRHFCFHPNQDVVYFSNEQACSVTAYRLDSSAGTLTAFQTVSTLPDGFEGRNTCSQIQIAPSGKFLYAPNRGHNSIAGFTVDAATCQLTPIGRAPTEAVPRAFTLDPQGNFLFAAGLDTGRLAAYLINGESGELEPLETYDVGRKPMWVLITRLPG